MSLEPTTMRGLEKLTYVRLAEALAQLGSLDQAYLAEILKESDRDGAPFPALLIRDEVLTEWELTRITSEHFALPIIFPMSYDLDRRVVQSADEHFLQKNNILPLARFGHIVTVVMPILSPFTVLEQMEKMMRAEVFPFVGPISENTQLLMDHFHEKAKSSDNGLGWEKMFDEVDASIGSLGPLDIE